MIKFHPSNAALVDFAEGNLASAEALFVSAHCDMCHTCHNKLLSISDSLASQYLNEQDDPCFDTARDVSATQIPRDYIAMFENITTQRNDTDTRKEAQAELSRRQNYEIVLDGKKFKIPPTLFRLTERMGQWSHLLGRIWQAQVDIGGGSLAQFIYMEKGGAVPEHTHKGHELTLVLDGSFSDGLHTYHSGDFIALSSHDTHAPKSDVDEGCLVLSIIDQPLLFTQGWAKLINPLSHLYFKVNRRA